MVVGKEESEKGLYKIHETIDKSVAIQDVRVFNETPMNSKKCVKTLIKVFYLFLTGAQLTTQESISLFFTLTKSFQSKHVYLKRIVFILLKEMAKVSNDTIIATSSLIHEYNTREDPWYRSAALRALVSVIQPSMIQSVERLLKQAILERDSGISSAALVSGYLLWDECKEAVRRWSGEIQQQLSNDSITQYHALGLVYLLKQNDRISLLKVLGGITKGNNCAPALMLALRQYLLLMQEGGYSIQRELSSFDISYYLKFKSRMEMVCFEAAKVIHQLSEIDHAAEDLVATAIKSMGLYLTSTKAVYRFAAIRILNLFSARFSPLVARHCNAEIESLVTDNNRSIATYAITTLLKTGNEQSIDNLIAQIGTFFTEISDEFKVIVVEAVQSLCNKFPTKQATMLEFLLVILRQEGGYDFKNSAMNCIFDILSKNDLLKEQIASSLAEYIEDCEFPNLTIRVLHLLGDEVAHLGSPSRYVRIIYNRLLLEASMVKTAAISALFRIAMMSGRFREEIKSLLKHALEDYDDEVRESALIYLCILDDPSISFPPLVESGKTFPLQEMEEKLILFCNDQGSAGPFPFDIEQMAVVPREEVFEETMTTQTALQEFTQTLKVSPSAEYETKDGIFDVPEVSALGKRLVKSPMPTWLTEKETEYIVSCVKHIFQGFIVFEVVVKNTLEDTALLDVSMRLTCLVEEFEDQLAPVFSTKISSLVPGQQDSLFLGYQYNREALPIGASLSSLLVFYSKAYDAGSFDAKNFSDCSFDEYQVEDVELYFGDFCASYELPGSFDRCWDTLSEESSETISLANVSSAQLAVDTLLQMIGNYPVEGTERIYGKEGKSHTLLVAISDIFHGGVFALIKLGLVFADRNSMYAEVTIRSNSYEFSSTIMSYLLHSE